MLLPDNLPPRTIMDRCRTVWADFKVFTRSATQGAIVQAFAVVRSHYPSVKPEVIMTSYARGTNQAKIRKLEDEAEEAAAKLAEDVDLFGKGEDNVQ